MREKPVCRTAARKIQTSSTVQSSMAGCTRSIIHHTGETNNQKQWKKNVENKNTHHNSCLTISWESLHKPHTNTHKHLMDNFMGYKWKKYKRGAIVTSASTERGAGGDGRHSRALLFSTKNLHFLWQRKSHAVFDEKQWGELIRWPSLETMKLVSVVYPHLSIYRTACRDCPRYSHCNGSSTLAFSSLLAPARAD